MPARPTPLRNTVEIAAFGHFLRTGHRADIDELLAVVERKFNPYHAEDGKFTSPQGVTVSPNRTSARLAERSSNRNSRVIAAPTQSLPRGGQIIAEAGLQAAQIAENLMKQGRIRTLASRPPVRALLHQIAKGEGVDDDLAITHGYASSYDVPFNYGRYAQQSKPLTQMNLGEIDELQSRMAAHPGNQNHSTPVGRYQIVRGTLQELKVKLGLNDDMIFDQGLQDMLGTKLLEKRGLQDYIEGKISESEFQRRMAAEWASIEMPQTGKTRTGQRLGTTTSQISSIIRDLRPK